MDTRSANSQHVLVAEMHDYVGKIRMVLRTLPNLEKRPFDSQRRNAKDGFRIGMAYLPATS